MGYLVGDCLMAAAFLSYAGPFLSQYRDELVQDTWLKQVSCAVADTYMYVTKLIMGMTLQLVDHTITIVDFL